MNRLRYLLFGAFLLGSTEVAAQEEPGEGGGANCGNCEQSTCPADHRLLTPTASGSYSNILYHYCAQRDNCTFPSCSGGDDDLATLKSVFGPRSSRTDVAGLAEVVVRFSDRIRIDSSGGVMLLGCDHKQVVRLILLSRSEQRALDIALASRYASTAFKELETQLR